MSEDLDEKLTEAQKDHERMQCEFEIGKVIINVYFFLNCSSCSVYFLVHGSFRLYFT